MAGDSTQEYFLGSGELTGNVHCNMDKLSVRHAIFFNFMKICLYQEVSIKKGFYSSSKKSLTGNTHFTYAPQ